MCALIIYSSLPYGHMIVTLLKIIQVKGHYDIPFKILLIFTKIIISISIVHAGHGIIQGKLFQLLTLRPFSAGQPSVWRILFPAPQ